MFGTPAVAWATDWYRWNKEYIDDEGCLNLIFLYWIILFFSFLYVVKNYTQ